MGQDVSSPIGAATHGQAFSQTEYTRTVMDQLLNYMLKQLSVRDLLHISKESECKKYILFKANAIYQYFYELRIFPTKDARGLLTFRKIDDLINPKGEQEKERQSLCLIVAYFYTRIFQIYGALALTLIDDMNYTTSSGMMTLPGTDARLLTPGHYAQQAYHAKGGVGLLPEDTSLLSSARVSKDPLDSLKNFKWIRSFLTSEYTSSLGFKTRYAGSSTDKAYIYLKVDPALKDRDGRFIASYDVPPLQSYQYGKFYIGIPGGINQYSTLDVYTLITPGEIKIKTNKLLFTNEFKENIAVDKFEMTFYIEQQIINGKTSFTIKDKSQKDVSLFLANYFSEIVLYIKDAVKQRKEIVEKSKTNTTTGRRSEEGITGHLRVEKMIDDLMVRKPLGHCIARALQLLKTEPFSNEPGITQICSATFSDNKRIGVVKPDAPLSDDAGLFALANLFYDTISIGSPNLTIGRNKIDGKSTFDEYVAFMNTLSKQYTLDPAPRAPAEYEEKGLSGIINKRDQAACPTRDDISLSLETTKKVSTIVKSMFQDQVNHASKCFKIISTLFHITYDKTTKKPTMIKLSDNVITKGFPELERINRAARELLVEYYTSCENKYWTGMKHVLQEQKNKKTAANALIKAEADAKARVEAAAAKAEENARIAAQALAKAAADKEKQAKIAELLKMKEAANAIAAQKERERDDLIARQQKVIQARLAEGLAKRDERRKLEEARALRRGTKEKEEQEKLNILARAKIDAATAAQKRVEELRKQRAAYPSLFVPSGTPK